MNFTKFLKFVKIRFLSITRDHKSVDYNYRPKQLLLSLTQYSYIV